MLSAFGIIYKHLAQNLKSKLKIQRLIIIVLSLFQTLDISAQISSQTNIKPYFDTTAYVAAGIDFQDYAKKQDGYWLFFPTSPAPDSAHVIVFVHGYGGYNPMIYGKWIKHLVRQGNIVIYPRYQKNLFLPRPDVFAENTAVAIRNAQKVFKKQDISPIWDELTMVGHSYGGVIIADLAVNFSAYDIPKPKAIMLVSPGTAYFKKGRLETYEAIPKDTKLIITVSNNDRVTGDEFGILVNETAINTPERVLYRQFADNYLDHPISAGHNESYSVDLDFDSGVRNYTAKRALRISQLNALDYNGYWRLFDALIACQRRGEECDLAFGKKGFFLGEKEDGTPLSPFQITLPK